MLLRELYAGGAAVTPDGLLSVHPADGHVLDRAGRPHPRRFALGPHTDARGSGAFTGPRTGGPAFRQNDATARAALLFLRAVSSRAAAWKPPTPALNTEYRGATSRSPHGWYDPALEGIR